MIKLEKHEVVGWEPAIRGMRNPKNSWDKSDSKWIGSVLKEKTIAPGITAMVDEPCEPYYSVGPNDFKLMMTLRNAGTDHRKYMRMIVVYVDITAPLYWWKEFDTYKVGTVANSCSTMHKIHSRDLTLDDFSTERLNMFNKNLFRMILDNLNAARRYFTESKDKDEWWQMIQLLPTSYNQKRTVMLNYEVLANIYKSRKNHKLNEWRELCEWIEKLPYSQIITGKEA